MTPGPRIIAARRFLKRTVIQSGLEAVRLLASAGFFAGARGSGAIFTLHHVRPARDSAFDPNAHLSVTPEFLAESIERLQAAGCTPVALADLPARIKASRESDGKHEHFVAFTLDDGYRNNAEYALPVFEKYSIPFTVFVSGGFIDRTHTIWWETAEALIDKVDRFRFDFGGGPVEKSTRTQIEKYGAFDHLHAAIACSRQEQAIHELDAIARANGIDPLAIVEKLVMSEDELASFSRHPLATLGAHTISHPNLASIPANDALKEMTASADRVEAITGKRPVTFSYPYGDACAVSEREVRLAQKAGFKVAVTTQPGMLNAETLRHPLALPRISLNGYYQKGRYVDALTSGIPFMRLHMATG